MVGVHKRKMSLEFQGKRRSARVFHRLPYGDQIKAYIEELKRVDKEIAADAEDVAREQASIERSRKRKDLADSNHGQEKDVDVLEYAKRFRLVYCTTGAVSMITDDNE